VYISRYYKSNEMGTFDLQQIDASAHHMFNLSIFCYVHML